MAHRCLAPGLVEGYFTEFVILKLFEFQQLFDENNYRKLVFFVCWLEQSVSGDLIAKTSKNSNINVYQK